MVHVLTYNTSYIATAKNLFCKVKSQFLYWKGFMYLSIGRHGFNWIFYNLNYGTRVSFISSVMMDWFCLGWIKVCRRGKTQTTFNNSAKHLLQKQKRFWNEGTIDELDIFAVDNDCIITDLEYDCDDKLSAYELAEMKLRKVLNFDEHA